MYKMHLISAEGYKNPEVDAKIVTKTGETWESMKDVGSCKGIKKIFNLVLKEIHGLLENFMKSLII